MRGYRHLSLHDRLKIESLLRCGVNQAKIAAALHVSPSTICRELKRGTRTYLNGDYLEVTAYIPEWAHEKYRVNLAAKGPALKIGSDLAYARTLEHLIADKGFSPSAAIHEILNHPNTYGIFRTKICRQTLYSYIQKGVFLRLANRDLPFRGTRGKKRRCVRRAAKQARGTSIEQRPVEINTRREFGHWEMDCVLSCRPGRKCLLVLTERVTRREIIRLMPDHTAASVVRALDALERKFGKLFPLVFRSITMDNGSEFADCAGLERSVLRKNCKRTALYYCHPYCSGERGSNEKQNQMIRRKFPKGTNFDLVSSKAVAAVEDWLNNYPRKILGWRSSNDIFRLFLDGA